MGALIDLSGKRFSKLTVIERYGYQGTIFAFTLKTIGAVTEKTQPADVETLFHELPEGWKENVGGLHNTNHQRKELL